MTTPPIPIHHHLVPATAPAMPPEFERIDSSILGGLPHTISPAQGVRFILTVPVGLARWFNEVDPAAVISSSTDFADRLEGRAAPRLIVMGGRRLRGSVPLVAATRTYVPNRAARRTGVRFELFIESWELHSGTLRSAGDYGSFLNLGWRRVGEADLEFEAPPIHPAVVTRLEAEEVEG